jgi:hypothetical protein
LERSLFWLGVICAICLILPLPICLYYFRRISALLSEIDKLQTEVRDHETLKARLDQLLVRNEKLETELKQTQENYRIKLLSTQEKHLETVDGMKEQLRALEMENRRLSGLILLKEQASKKL